MDNAYVLTFPAFMAFIVGLVWWLFQRQIKKADDEAKEKESAVQKQFADFKEWMQKQGDRLREAEIEIERRITRDDLDKLKAELKQDFQTFQAAILAAIGRAS